MADSTTIPDNLGTNQTRVLDSANRSFESVVYQRKKPPLSCEVNLTGNLAAKHAQEVFQASTPSGWTVVGSIRDNLPDNQLRTGDLSCSFNLPANTIKLIANDRGVETGTLIAWVNGEKLLVQGSSSTGDQNNVILLPNPPTSAAHVNFVFLEVWRKLLTTEDTTYPKYGNVLYGGSDNFANDLIDPAIGIETSLRIQVQYRIRVVSNIDIQTYPDGFDPNAVFVQGPLDNPVSTCDHAFFSPMPGDPGLWRAGIGDTAAQDQLQTVDGYTYAIPMFAISRRNTSAYDPELRANGAGKTLANYLAGLPSDRPDDKYNNWIVADDVLDLRFRISSAQHAKEICEDAFIKMASGHHFRTKMGRSLVGEDHFGPTLVQIDGVTSDYPGWGWTSQIAYPDGYRRAFSNAATTQSYTLQKITTGSPWADGSSFQIITVPPYYPSGSTITSIDDSYLNKGTSTLGPLNLNGVAATVGQNLSSLDSKVYTNSGDPSLPWTHQSGGDILPPPEVLRSVTWCHNKFFSVGDMGSILVSNPIGTVWEDKTSITGQTLNDVNCNTTAIVVVGNSSQIYRSVDEGDNWTLSSTIVPANYNGIAWSSTFNLFMAVGDDGCSNGIISHSSDGDNWAVASAIPAASKLNSVAWSPTATLGGIFVAVGDGGALLFSTDAAGDGWTASTDSGIITTGDLRRVAWSDVLNLFVAVGSPTSLAPVIYSSDGQTWSVGVPGSQSADDYHGIVWAGDPINQFIAVGSRGPGVGLVSTSSDGVNFTDQQVPTGTFFLLRGVAWGETARVTGTGSDTVTVTIRTAAGLGSDPLIFDYTVTFPYGPNGFTKLPDQMLGFRKEHPSTSPYIASTDSTVRVRTDTAYPVVLASDDTRFSTLINKGASILEPWDFGHQMLYDTTGPGSNVVVFPRTLYNYPILGVASISDDIGFRNIVDVTRTTTDYFVTFDGGSIPPTQAMELALYTGVKFFQTNKQGRAILDSFQMTELRPVEAADGARTSFTVDTTNEAIIALASNKTLDGTVFAYLNGLKTDLLTNNITRPVDTTKARAQIEFSSPPFNGSIIEVPILTASPIGSADGYIFLYKTIPYQGILTAQTQGPVEAIGPSLVTSAGSGGIKNYTYEEGLASFSSTSTTITADFTGFPDANWTLVAKPGDLIYATAHLTEKLTIREVFDSHTIFVNAPPSFTSASPEAYKIERLDLPSTNQSNIIDRFPALDSNKDSSGLNDPLFTRLFDIFNPVDPTLELRVLASIQPFTDHPYENVEIGKFAADRGRAIIHINEDNLIGLGNVGLKFEALSSAPSYSKAYQSYLVNKDNSGELYLMIYASETHNSAPELIPQFNPNANSDSVDLFRVPGRPAVVRRSIA